MNAPIPATGVRLSPASVRALLIDQPVALDGKLDESFWATADSIDDLRQREPLEGAPATERTVLRVARDMKALYVGVRADDRDMAAIRASQLRRDADLEPDDRLTLLLDTLNDRRSGFVFQTNPRGAMWDAQIAALDEVNENWNGIWEVAVSRDSAGWTAEFQIPFSTLRFRSTPSAWFGFNVQRFIRRKNEEDLWRSFGRTQGLFQLLDEGAIEGLGELGRHRDVELRPYLLARAVESEHDLMGGRVQPGELEGEAGVDAKIGVAATATADLTVNTDFAEVEADRDVVNLTRFPLFFPEKREFFLESSGLFDFGTSQRAQLFYSRRIGLDPDGEVVPIAAGARLYGKIGPWSLGALGVRTGGDEQANEAVIRLRHDLLARSFVGAMATMRTGPGVEGTESAVGLDLDLPLVVSGRNLEPSFWIAGTHVPGADGTRVAWRAAVDFPNDLFDNFVSLYRIDAGFDPTLGFVRRTGIRETTGHIDFTPRPGWLGIRQLDIEAPGWDIIADAGGSLFSAGDWQTAEFEVRPIGGSFQSGDLFELNIRRTLDAPADTFDVFRDVVIAPGRYWWTRGEAMVETSPARPLAFTAVVSHGGFYDGHSTEVSLDASWRGSGHLVLGADMARTGVHLPDTRFNAVQASGRLEYAFDTRTSFLAFVQYNNEDQRVDFNLRFHWIPVIGDDLYVVWTSGYSTDPEAAFRFPGHGVLGRPLDGALVFKAVHRLAL